MASGFESCQGYQMPYTDIVRRNANSLKRITERRNRRKLEAIIRLGGKCADCPFDDLSRLEVFQFDHRPGSGKLKNIGHMLGGYSDERLQKELGKCDLVCANCHATRTVQRTG
jgi:hypothetical protein